MAYTPTTWVNGASPAINAPNLNKIEQGIVEAHNGNPFEKSKYNNSGYEKYFSFRPVYGLRGDFCKIPSSNFFVLASTPDSSSNPNIFNLSNWKSEHIDTANYISTTAFLPSSNILVLGRSYNSNSHIYYGTFNRSSGTVSTLTSIETNFSMSYARFFTNDDVLGVYRQVTSSGTTTHYIGFKGSYSTADTPTTIFSFTDNTLNVVSVFKAGNFYYILAETGELRKYNSSGVLQSSTYLNRTLLNYMRGCDYADGKLYVLGTYSVDGSSGGNIGVMNLPI